jgi:Tripartite tricarboxylate transporter family receptor
VPWFGLLAPAGTPKDVLDKLHVGTVKTLAMPEVRGKFDELGIEPVGNTQAEFAAVIRKEIPAWAKVIKDAGIKLGNQTKWRRAFYICYMAAVAGRSMRASFGARAATIVRFSGLRPSASPQTGFS